MANTTNWLSISSQSGSSGQTILTLSANKNLSAGTKTAEVTAYNPVYNISAKTYVTIDAYSPYIYVSDSIIGIPASGGTYQLGIESNCSFVIAYPNMVSTYSTSAGTGNISVTFSVPATYQSQTITENIVITDESGQYSIVVRLEQYGSEPEISAVPPELLFEANGGTLYFTVSANCVYHIDNSVISGWCSVSPQSGYTGSTTFTVTTTANTGDSAKTGIISVIGPGTAGDMVQVRQKRTTVQIPYTADTSTIEASGETRTITIDTTGLVDSSITVDIQNAPGATYTYSNGVITLTIPDNAGLQRDIVVSVTGKTTGGDDAATSITFTQAEHTTVQIPYTADTSTVDASGETRTITIDTTGLIASSITIGVEGATGVTYTYNNGVVTVVFPENSGSSRNITVNVTGQTINGNSAVAAITYNQEEHITVPISYTADTSPVDALGETRTITIDTTGLIASSITVSIEGATGVTYTYNNGVVTVVFPENSGSAIASTVQIAGKTTERDNAIARITYVQKSEMTDVPLTFVVTNSGTIIYSRLSSSSNLTIQYKKNDGEWTNISSSTGGTSINVVSGDIVRFRGDNVKYGGQRFSHSTATFRLEGNIMSLISSTGFDGLLTLTASDAFEGLFASCTGLTSAEKLELPAIELSEQCYFGLFYNCASLTIAPRLPATTLASGCYFHMFEKCTSLTIAPRLPATTLANSCYRNMFRDCIRLTNPPELPVTVLSPRCYQHMFLNCTALQRAPELPATTLVTDCYMNMFSACTNLNYIKCLATYIPAASTIGWVKGVSSTGTFVKNPAMSDWTTGNNGIPSGWTVQDAT